MINNDDVTIDMVKTEYISSAGLRVFVKSYKKKRALQLPSIQIINVSDNVRDIFEITGLVSLLEI